MGQKIKKNNKKIKNSVVTEQSRRGNLSSKIILYIWHTSNRYTFFFGGGEGERPDKIDKNIAFGTMYRVIMVIIIMLLSVWLMTTIMSMITRNSIGNIDNH